MTDCIPDMKMSFQMSFYMVVKGNAFYNGTSMEEDIGDASTLRGVLFDKDNYVEVLEANEIARQFGAELLSVDITVKQAEVK